MLKPATGEQALALQHALYHLREARRLLKKAGAPRAVEKVRRALKSAEGAERHMERRRFSS